ncbi:MAG TPA: hypothetical protein VMP86_03395 [Candidatus Binatia bacterium]|nr:hypothetical protein [Candidatus Binatia bacterium]
MSREERRQYARQMKSMERGAAIPPGARARAERNAARRAERRAKAESRPRSELRSWLRLVLIAAAVGFVAFSLQWGEGMPRALYAGLVAGAVTFALLLGFRLVRRRASRS